MGLVLSSECRREGAHPMSPTLWLQICPMGGRPEQGSHKALPLTSWPSHVTDLYPSPLHWATERV